MAALTLLNEDPQLTDVVIRSIEGIGGMVSNITHEGGWQEGRHYSVYGLCQSMMFMDAIKRLSDGKINMFLIDGVKNAPADFALFGMTGNFNDGTFRDKGIGGPIGSPGMYGKLAAETGNTNAMFYIKTFLNRPNALFGGIRNNATNTIWDLIWPMPTDIPATKPADASKHFPEIDWAEFGNRFLTQKLKIERETYTTQISNYDNFAALFDNLRRINNIIIDLDRDFWTYISMTYFKQKIKAGEVGSSAMPHKVNPIDFENSEGNLGIANAIFDHLSNKLPISRLQRDLTDSTVLRNIGVPLAHTIIAVKSTLKGLNKLIINKEAIEKDLEKNWAVVAEAIQTVLRREGYPNPYEALKALTRTNNKITQESIAEFIDTLDISAELKKTLKQITPSNYTGI